MDDVDLIRLPADVTVSQSQLYSLVDAIRIKETTYKSSGSVHACALFDAASPKPEMLLFVEDVGRHNAIDTIAGWMCMNMAPTFVASRTALPPEGPLRLRPGKAGSAAFAGQEGATLPGFVPTDPVQKSLVFYTTGRLTSEMVIKSAQMGIAVVISRSGITQMGHAVAQKVGLCAIGRALNKRFLCFTAPHRLKLASQATDTGSTPESPRMGKA
jgi:FdhD protein